MAEIKNVRFALCAGRHDIPDVQGYIFRSIPDVTDVRGMDKIAVSFVQKLAEDHERHVNLELVVTGLSVALCSVIAAFYKEAAADWEGEFGLTLLHWDRESGSYYPQVMRKVYTCRHCGKKQTWGDPCPKCLYSGCDMESEDPEEPEEDDSWLEDLIAEA